MHHLHNNYYQILILIITLAAYHQTTSFSVSPSNTTTTTQVSRDILSSTGSESTTTTKTTKTYVVLQHEIEKSYWIRNSHKDITLFIVAPIAIGILLIVLVFFLWIFSEGTESNEQFDYDQLFGPNSDEPVAGPSSLSFPPPASPTHPIVDQILDLPYTNPHQNITQDTVVII